MEPKRDIGKILKAIKGMALAGGIITTFAVSTPLKASDKPAAGERPTLQVRLEQVRAAANNLPPTGDHSPKKLQSWGNWPNQGWSSFNNWNRWQQWQQQFGNFFNN